MLNVENLAIYFIFSLVMVIALFNLIGALIMMVLDKQRQLKILLCLGARPKGIQKYFFTRYVNLLYWWHLWFDDWNNYCIDTIILPFYISSRNKFVLSRSF